MWQGRQTVQPDEDPSMVPRSSTSSRPEKLIASSGDEDALGPRTPAKVSLAEKLAVSMGDGDANRDPLYYPEDSMAVRLSKFSKLEISVGDVGDDDDTCSSPMDKDFERVRRNFMGNSFRDEWTGANQRSTRRRNSTSRTNGTFSDVLDRRLFLLRDQLIADHEHGLAGDREQYLINLQEENNRLRRKLQESNMKPGLSSKSCSICNTFQQGARGGSKPISNFLRQVTPPTPAPERYTVGSMSSERFGHCSGPPMLELKSNKARPNGGLNPDDGQEQEDDAASDDSWSRRPSKDSSSKIAEFRRASGKFTTSELAGWTGDEDNEQASRKALMQLWGHGNDWINLGVFFSTWKHFVQKVKEGEVYNDDDEINERKIAAQQLWPPLDVMRTSVTESVLGRTVSSPSSAGRSTSHGDYYMDTNSSLQKLVAPPNSKKRMVWDSIGFLLVCWDAFMIPMYAFELGDSKIVITMSYVTTVFWTVDFPSNFFVAFYSEGIVEMRPSKVAFHYIKTWCAIDALVILLDWSFIFLGLHDDAGQAGRWARFRINRISRVFRMLRVLRLIRAAKMLPKIQMMFNEIHSDIWRLTMSIFRSVMIIVAINHVVACTWYTIGNYNHEDPETWLKYDLMTGDAAEAWRITWGYRYTTSLHWSFCQFTPASMEIHPRNLRERIFAVIIIICGMVTFSSFISSITSSLTQLRNLNTDKHQEETLIKQYFNENRVSVDLGKCVMDWLHANRRRRIFRVHEGDLPTFQDLPERLKFQLHLEVFGPILTVHPFFETFQDMDSRGLYKICHRAASQHRLLSEQELFSRGMRTNRMYFVIVGECRFTLPHFESSDVHLLPGSWCCEVALWIPWIHLGSLTASTITELVSVDAGAFQQTFPQCSKMVKRFVRAYASLFVRHECDEMQEGQPWITDICCNPDHMGYICMNAREWVARNFSHKVGRREHSLSSNSDMSLNKKGSPDLRDSNFKDFTRQWLGIADTKHNKRRMRHSAMVPRDVQGQEQDFEATRSRDSSTSSLG